MTCTYGYSHFRHFKNCCNRDGNTNFKYMNYVPIVGATDLEVHFSVLKKGVSQFFCLYSVCTSHWCLVMSFWHKVCIYSHTRGVKLGLGLRFLSYILKLWLSGCSTFSIYAWLHSAGLKWLRRKKMWQKVDVEFQWCALTTTKCAFLLEDYNKPFISEGTLQLKVKFLFEDMSTGHKSRILFLSPALLVPWYRLHIIYLLTCFTDRVSTLAQTNRTISTQPAESSLFWEKAYFLLWLCMCCQ